MRIDAPIISFTFALQLSKCKQKDDDDNEKEQGEAKKFEEGPHVQSVVSRVSAAMGLKQNLSYGV